MRSVCKSCKCNCRAWFTSQRLWSSTPSKLRDCYFERLLNFCYFYCPLHIFLDFFASVPILKTIHEKWMIGFQFTTKHQMGDKFQKILKLNVLMKIKHVILNFVSINANIKWIFKISTFGFFYSNVQQSISVRLIVVHFQKKYLGDRIWKLKWK